MTQIKQHTLQSGERILLVSVPENIRNITVNPHPINPLGNWLWWYQGKAKTGLPIPLGNWQLIGLSDEITEEHAKELVETAIVGKSWLYKFRDYTKHRTFGLTALESLKSFMQSLGCEGRYAVLREVK